MLSLGGFLIITLTIFSKYPSGILGNICKDIPPDTRLSRQPGDGHYTLKFELISPETKLGRGSGNRDPFWTFVHPISVNQSKTNEDHLDENSTFDYIPGRDYQVTIAPREPSASPIESAYIITVPIDTPEIFEIDKCIGRFSPTFCSKRCIGSVVVKYNFPKQITFVWSAPKDDLLQEDDDEKDSVNGPLTCIEMRATVVPFDWHRIFYRNTGGLRRVLCPVKDFRKIIGWPNYVEDGSLVHHHPRSFRNEPVRARSINNLDNNHEVRDGYSDTGFYGTDELSGSCSLQELPKPVRKCCACHTAIYRIIIQSDWQQQQHWKDWPTTGVPGENGNIPPHFSEVLGASHSPEYDLFHMGWYASPAVDAMCTKSDVSKLENEFRNQAGENILTVIRTRGIESHAPPEQRVRSALFAVNSSHHLISFLTRLVPSPDWCTGLSRIDVCSPNCTWPKHLQFRLEPWDAGVMSGNTYIPVEPSERLREPKPMCPMTPELRPNVPFTVISEYTHPLDASRLFGDVSTGENAIMGIFTPMEQPGPMHPPRIRRQFAPIGMVYLELLRINENEDCSSNAVQDDQSSMDAVSDLEQQKCHLTTWTEWGPCVGIDLNSCPPGDVRNYWSNKEARAQRTRSILSQSNPNDCAGMQLKEEKPCQPIKQYQPCPAIPKSDQLYPKDHEKSNTKNQQFCQSLPWGPWSACINATCSRPGMIYRWRKFPDANVRASCDGFPEMSQVDTCWPPSNNKCSPKDFAEACLEEPPTSVRLCLKPPKGVTRYYYHSSQRLCKPFNYVPECHLRAILSQHRIGLTRNVFHDRALCEQTCMFNESKISRVKRHWDSCRLPPDVGRRCDERDGTSTRWYFNGEQCLPFMYSGCLGNGNNFLTADLCKRACLQKSDQNG